MNNKGRSSGIGVGIKARVRVRERDDGDGRSRGGARVEAREAPRGGTTKTG
ncbi:hypothetical protein HPP92_002106 [Vanilla planifolia]|uniref:Uncharacterized protein n=1 Tax=Vanilla planifolia TaxID=51239 RepID=A0A835RZ99_VANPL|nr:hypothetical protein HPP92_002106 [Vanilla planifolia]